MLRIGGTNSAISVVNNFKVRVIFRDDVFCMWHELNSKSRKLFDKIEGFPPPKSFLKFFIELEVFKGEEMSFYLNEGKIFNILVDLFAHGLGVDSKFEHSAIFESDV